MNGGGLDEHRRPGLGHGDGPLTELTRDEGEVGERAVTVPETGPTVLIEAAAFHSPAPSASGLPYQQDPEATAPAENPGRDQVIATAIPYFQWDNRDGRAMRVWMPRA